MTEVEEYQKALADFSTARGKIGSMAATIKLAAQSFEKWEKLDPLNLNGSLEKAMNKWPSIEYIEATIKEWQDTWKTVLDTWETIHPNNRIGLKNPQESI